MATKNWALLSPVHFTGNDAHQMSCAAQILRQKQAKTIWRMLSSVKPNVEFALGVDHSQTCPKKKKTLTRK